MSDAKSSNSEADLCSGITERAPFRMGWGAPWNNTRIRGELWIATKSGTKKEDVMAMLKEFCDDLRVQVEENFDNIVQVLDTNDSQTSPEN